MTETFDWLKPSLLWQADRLDFRQKEFFQPQLLEFGSDNFMEEFFAAATAPRPTAFEQVVAKPPAVDAPLKLYQPIHGRFYLVCGSLCCRQAGFPDRQIRSADGENVFFVIRKLIGGVEYAWLTAGATKGWNKINGQSRQVLKGEERHPLMMTVTGNCRTLFFGYLPVASRETYAVPPSELAVPDQASDPRIQELGSRFTGPLTDATLSGKTVLNAAPTELDARLLSVYLLLDLWEYLNTYLDDVASAIRDNPNATFTGEKAAAKSALLAYFKNTILKNSLTFATALQKVAQKQMTLNQTGGVTTAQLNAQGFGSDYDLRTVTINMAELQQNVQNALSDQKPPIRIPKIDEQRDAHYLLRCVYERPQCEPTVQVVSQPTQSFTLAAFFDPDAPTRTVRIPLPTDVSIAGLRKFKKGVTFMMSDALRKKMLSIVGNEKALLTDSPSLGTPGDDFAFICSFSIQIIFIVAFFLLLMFVVILNFVFWWIAFFKICLPIPKRLLPG